MFDKTLVIKIKSTIGVPQKTRKVMCSLGFGEKSKLGKSTIHELSPSVLGMLKKVKHLVKLSPIEKKDETS